MLNYNDDQYQALLPQFLPSSSFRNPVVIERHNFLDLATPLRIRYLRSNETVSRPWIMSINQKKTNCEISSPRFSMSLFYKHQSINFGPKYVLELEEKNLKYKNKKVVVSLAGDGNPKKK
jgi:hypothetical protein